MSSKNSFTEFLAKKEVRFGLAALCAYFALASLYELSTGEQQHQWLRGGGGLLLWGGWAVLNAMKPYGKALPGINTAINVGLVLVLASWFVR